MGFAPLALAVTAVAGRCAEAFITPPAALLMQPSVNSPSFSGRGGLSGLRMKYIPDGVSPEEWKKIKAKEEAEKKRKDLGRIGVKGFQSRSLQAWQEAGGSHLFPVNPTKVKTGDIPLEKTPYMQRGGSWDDSDLAKKNLRSQTGKKITKKQWSETDRAYAKGGSAKGQSASIFPGDPLQWISKSQGGADKTRSGGTQKEAGRPAGKGPAKSQVKGRPGKEASRKKDKDSKLKSQLKSEGKKGLFGLW